MNSLELLELNNLLEEFKKRQQHAFIKYIPDDNPERNQKLFHEQTNWCRLIFGGNRSGKSRSAAQEIAYIVTCSSPFQKYEGPARVWVVSVEYRTIYEGIWLHLKNALPYWEIKKMGPKVASNHEIPSFIEMKNGSRIDFISAIGGEDTRRKLQSAEIDYLFIDEEIDGDLWDELQMRLLTRGGRVVISATLVQSEDWLLNLEKQSYLKNSGITLIRLNTKFNKYNDQEALKRVLSRLSPEEQEVRILGKSRKLTGLIYTNWDDRHIIKPFEIPTEWTKLMAFDAGFRTAAALWVAITPENKCIAYREMYLHDATLTHIVDFIKAAENWPEKDVEGENITIRIIDPSSFRTLEDGSVGVGVQLAAHYNLYFTPANNDWRSGVEAIRRMLMADPQGVPYFRIFSTLENFQLERSKYRVAPPRTDRNRDQAPDRPLSRDDHLMDCWRYIMVSEPQYISSRTPKEQFDHDALHIDDVPDLDRSKKIRLLHRKQQILRERNNGWD